MSIFSPALPDWPLPSARILVNANHYIAPYPKNHPAYFPAGSIVTDLTYWPSPDPIVDRVIALKVLNGVVVGLNAAGMKAGVYVSASTVRSQSIINTKGIYPEQTVVKEDLQLYMSPKVPVVVGQWPGDPDRDMLSLDDVNTRVALQALIKQHWLKYPSMFRFLDNLPSGPDAGGKTTWQGICAHVMGLRTIAEETCSRAIFNIFAHPGLFKPADLQLWIDSIGPHGMCIEDPWHVMVRNNPVYTTQQKAAYRTMLDAGMAIIAMNNPPSDLTTQQWLAWSSLWRKPADKLYTAVPYFVNPAVMVNAPLVMSVSPKTGAGAITVTLSGKYFTGATAVNFGTVPATAVNVISDTQITCTSPAGTGSVDVVVVNPGTPGKSPVWYADKFAYI
jgi:hypothetical protein